MKENWSSVYFCKGKGSSLQLICNARTAFLLCGGVQMSSSKWFKKYDKYENHIYPKSELMYSTFSMLFSRNVWFRTFPSFSFLLFILKHFFALSLVLFSYFSDVTFISLYNTSVLCFLSMGSTHFIAPFNNFAAIPLPDPFLSIFIFLFIILLIYSFFVWWSHLILFR